ncbi:PAAR domain-containing protein [Pseudomonas sp. EA_15y_Pfl2_R67]|uniref:PAAR domain-containing protein n=1 Tax=Pseudomonas sp. EA_15y_Pfl2_R67 TaxID=3088687 RepID=UPI0030D75955
MMRVIRIGDPLRPFGGKVLEGSFLAFGQPMASVGGKVRCDLHGENRIAQGAAGFSFNGQLLALHGYRCDCGCTLVSTLPLSSITVTP